MTIRRDTCKICGAVRWERSEMRFCRKHHNEYHARKQAEGAATANKKRDKMTEAYARLRVRELVDLRKGAA
jgi:hypothetical protein